MTIFVCMYIALFILWAFSNINGASSKRKNVIWFFAFLTLWLIQALRHPTIGTDLIGYLPCFINVEFNTSPMGFEPGFVFFMAVIRHYITDNESIYLAIVAFCALLPITLLYRRYSANQALSYITFVSIVLYTFSFSGLRQAIALGLVALGYHFALKKKLILFVGTIYLASLFHISAIVFIVIYFLINYITMTPKKYLWAFIVGITIILAMRSILDSIVPMIFGEDKYISYVEHEAVASYNLFIFLVGIFFFTFLSKGTNKNLDNYRILIFCAILGQSLGFISTTASRIAYYFILFVALAVPETIYTMKTSALNRKLLALGFAFFMVFFFFYTFHGFTIFINNHRTLVDYRFLWE